MWAYARKSWRFLNLPTNMNLSLEFVFISSLIWDDRLNVSTLMLSEGGGDFRSPRRNRAPRLCSGMNFVLTWERLCGLIDRLSALESTRQFLGLHKPTSFGIIQWTSVKMVEFLHTRSASDRASKIYTPFFINKSSTNFPNQLQTWGGVRYQPRKWKMLVAVSKQPFPLSGSHASNPSKAGFSTFFKFCLFAEIKVKRKNSCTRAARGTFSSALRNRNFEH